MSTKVLNSARLVDIAQKAGVSRITVAKVLHNGGGKNTRVSDETAEKIRKIATELHYSPNIVARQLAGKRSQVIGVIIDSYAAQVDYIKLAEAERQAAQRGYRFMVGQSHGELDRIAAYAQDFTQRGAEGIVCISHEYPETNSSITQIFNRLKNVVYIYRPQMVDDNIPYVDSDIRDGICQAFDYLVARGRKRIAMITTSSLVPKPIQARCRGYAESLARHGVLEDISVNLSSFGEFDRLDNLGPREQEVLAREMKLLIHERKADGILAENDILACMVIKRIRAEGLRVPEDISVIGYDNLQLGALYEPPLTTLDQRPKEQAQLAINLLADMIEGREIPQEQRQVVLKPRLIVRESA